MPNIHRVRPFGRIAPVRVESEVPGSKGSSSMRTMTVTLILSGMMMTLVTMYMIGEGEKEQKIHRSEYGDYNSC